MDYSGCDEASKIIKIKQTGGPNHANDNAAWNLL
jgi:hypothetical protein